MDRTTAAKGSGALVLAVQQQRFELRITLGCLDAHGGQHLPYLRQEATFLALHHHRDNRGMPAGMQCGADPCAHRVARCGAFEHQLSAHLRADRNGSRSFARCLQQHLLPAQLVAQSSLLLLHDADGIELVLRRLEFAPHDHEQAIERVRLFESGVHKHAAGFCAGDAPALGELAAEDTIVAAPSCGVGRCLSGSCARRRGRLHTLRAGHGWRRLAAADCARDQDACAHGCVLHRSSASCSRIQPVKRA